MIRAFEKFLNGLSTNNIFFKIETKTAIKNPETKRLRGRILYAKNLGVGIQTFKFFFRTKQPNELDSKNLDTSNIFDTYVILLKIYFFSSMMFANFE